MAEQQRQSLCPRLIDYLAIVGSRSASVKHGSSGQNPPVQVSVYFYFCNLKFYHQLYYSLEIVQHSKQYLDR